jgi:hypothetical protein
MKAIGPPGVNPEQRDGGEREGRGGAVVLAGAGVLLVGSGTLGSPGGCGRGGSNAAVAVPDRATRASATPRTTFRQGPPGRLSIARIYVFWTRSGAF